MPAGLYADWNDCLRLGKDGESTFVALQFYYAMTILKEFAKYKKDEKYIKYLEEKQEQLGKLIQELCWNEDRFIRGFTEQMCIRDSVCSESSGNGYFCKGKQDIINGSSDHNGSVCCFRTYTDQTADL